VSHETRSLQGRQPVLDHRGARPEVTHKLLRVPGDFVELVQPKQQLDIPDGSDPETDEVEKLALDCALPAPLNRASWLEQSRGGGKRRPRVSELSETGEQCCKGNRSLELGPKIEARSGPKMHDAGFGPHERIARLVGITVSLRTRIAET
jgi:hypothetical protein